MNDEVKRYDGIQILRAIGCIFVILCHTKFFNRGSFGVDIFLVISGFMLIYSTQKNVDNFLVKRIKKIVPMYWIMTIVTAIFVCFLPELFNSYEFTWKYLFKSLFFIPYEHSGIEQPLLGLGWTLNYEMFIYVIFFIGIKLSKKYRGVITSIICCLLVLVRPMDNVDNFYIHYYGNDIIIEFVLGMGLYYFIKHYEGILKKISANAYLLMSGVLFIVLWYVQDNSYRGFINGGIAALIFLCVFMWSIEKKFSSKNIFVIIGNVSYYIYLTHIYVVRICEKCMNFLPGFIIVSISIIASCFIGVICDRILVKTLLKNKK